MSLTESKIKDLEEKNFDRLFEGKREKGLAMVPNACEFTQDHVTGGNVPGPDDILKVLLPTLEVYSKTQSGIDAPGIPV